MVRAVVVPQVTCVGGCTDNVYCSDECAAADWAAHHSLLCAGPRAPPAPVVEPSDSPEPRYTVPAFAANRMATYHAPPGDRYRITSC